MSLVTSTRTKKSAASCGAAHDRSPRCNRRLLSDAPPALEYRAGPVHARFHQGETGTLE